MKSLFCIVLSAILLLSSNVNAIAAPVTKVKVIGSTTKEQYTNIYGMYTSFKAPSSIAFWKKDTYYLSTRFNSAKQIMLKDITGATKWEGSASKVSYIDIAYSSTVSVSANTSVDLGKQINVGVSIKVVEISKEIGGNVLFGVTFTKEDVNSYSTRVNKKSPAGYYGLICAVNADLFDVTVTKDANTYKGNMLKFESEYPYIMVYYSTKSY